MLKTMLGKDFMSHASGGLTKLEKKIHPCPDFIAMQIKYWRKKKKMTQKEVSEASGIKIRHYQEIESGRVDMKIRTLGLISNALNVTPHILLTPIPENRDLICENCRHLI